MMNNVTREKIVKFADKMTFFSLCIVIFCIGFSNAGVESFFGFVFLGFIIKKLFSRPKLNNIFSNSSLVLPLLIFILANFLSLLNSKQCIKLSLEALLFKWLEYVILYFIVVDTVNTKRKINIVVAVLLFSVSLVGIDGIYQRVAGVDFLRHWTLSMVMQSGAPAISGAFNHYNDLAAYLVTLLPLLICVYFCAKHKIGLLYFILSVVMILNIACLIGTFSRAGWISFTASLIIILIIMQKKRVLFFGLLVVFLLCLLLIPDLRMRVWVTFLAGGDAQRLNIWKDSLIMIKEHPVLGMGVGTFMENFEHYGNFINPYAHLGQYAHNCFLQIWAEAGIFALLSFLWFVILIFVKGIKAFRIRGNYLLLGVVSGFFAFLVHSSLDTGLYSLRLAFLFWFMAGLTAAITKLETIASKQESTPKA